MSDHTQSLARLCDVRSGSGAAFQQPVSDQQYLCAADGVVPDFVFLGEPGAGGVTST
jgi:hypothetical protein